MPVYPGAAAYYDDSEKTLFERYGDALFYGPMLLGFIGAAHTAVSRAIESFDRPQSEPAGATPA